MYYVFFILFCMALIILLNEFFVVSLINVSFFKIALYTVIAVVMVIAIDGLVAFLVRWCMPKKWFDVQNDIFLPSKKRTAFYEKIGVKKWKDKIPDWGGLTGFSKSKIENPTSIEFVGQFIVEINYGIVVHMLGMVVGFLILLIFPKFAFHIALPVAIVNLILNYLSLVVLKYNLPKLRAIYKFNLRRQESLVTTNK